MSKLANDVCCLLLIFFCSASPHFSFEGNWRAENSKAILPEYTGKCAYLFRAHIRRRRRMVEGIRKGEEEDAIKLIGARGGRGGGGGKYIGFARPLLPSFLPPPPRSLEQDVASTRQTREGICQTFL